jgi:hypothetical protein
MREIASNQCLSLKVMNELERIYLQALGVWVVFVILAIVNGALRSKVYGPAVERELLAHQLSTVTAVLLFLVTMHLFFAKTSSPSSRARMSSADSCSHRASNGASVRAR